jgi:hypothetical protein
LTKAWFGDASGMTPDELVYATFPLSRLWQQVQRGRRRAIAENNSGDPQAVPCGQAAAHVPVVPVLSTVQDVILEDAHAKGRAAAVAALNTTPPPQSDRERQAAQAELAYLRTYSDVYRAHLRAYTEQILREIEEWEHSETASFRDTPSHH